jgi:hypothetical protein
MQGDLQSENRDVRPSASIHRADETAPPLALRAPAPILIRLHSEMQLLIAICELEPFDFQLFKAQNLA